MRRLNAHLLCRLPVTETSAYRRRRHLEQPAALLTAVHVASALAGLVLGAAALRFPNGTPRHRVIGKGYLLAWVGIGASGFALGADSPSLSPFEVLTVVGLLFVALAYGAVLFRRRIGRRWLRYHYLWMTTSLAALVVTAINQTLLQTVGPYPQWLFWAIVLSPFAYMPTLHRRLDERYGFARQREAA